MRISQQHSTFSQDERIKKHKVFHMSPSACLMWSHRQHAEIWVLHKEPTPQPCFLWLCVCTECVSVQIFCYMWHINVFLGLIYMRVGYVMIWCYQANRQEWLGRSGPDHVIGNLAWCVFSYSICNGHGIHELGLSKIIWYKMSMHLQRRTTLACF